MLEVPVNRTLYPPTIYHGVTYHGQVAPVWKATLTGQTSDYTGPDIRLTDSGATIDLEVTEVTGIVVAVLEDKHVGHTYQALWSMRITAPGLSAGLVGQGATPIRTMGHDVRLRLTVAGPAASVSLVARLIPW